LDENGKIHWHDAFFEALQLELYQYRDFLTFQSEHRLSEEALKMDVLVIKKDKDVYIEKNIGQIFKGANIFEYKSETDSFSRWDYNKVLGYAFLYSAFERMPITDITVTIALTIYPRELIKTLENERGLRVNDLGNGIYYVNGEVVPIQILESKRLSPDSNLFLRNLRSNLSADDMLKTLRLYNAYKPIDDRMVYLDRLIKANIDVFKEVKQMGALKELFMQTAEESGWLEQDRVLYRTQGITQGRIQGIEEVAKAMLTRGYSAEEVAETTKLPLKTVINLL